MTGVVTVLSVVSFVVVAGGSFLRHDAYPGHDAVGKAGEVAGWAGLFLASLLAQQEAADAAVECSVFRRCEFPATAGGLLWSTVRPYLIDSLCGALALGVGWGLALLTRRSPVGDLPGKADGGARRP